MGFFMNDILIDTPLILIYKIYKLYINTYAVQ